jgi:molybdate transport system ATP-binding protein
VLSEGRVIAAGPLEDVFGRIDLGAATGRHEAGAVLIATVAGHDRDFALTRLSVDGAELSVPLLDRAIGASMRVRIRARDVSLALSRPEGVSIRNVLPAAIVSIDIEDGAYAEVLLRSAGHHLRAEVTRKSAVELGLAPGREVFALIKSIAIEADRPERR